MAFKNYIRIVTAASLFDGHDASINMIRRLLQDSGAEVVHLGHNRSVHDVVSACLQEGAQGVCISSYQGGHMEYFKYLRDCLNEAGAGYVKIYGGGGGVIIHEEKAALEKYGIAQVFHPDDGRRLGLQGMIDLILAGCDFDIHEAAKKVEAQAINSKAAPIGPRAQQELDPATLPSRDLGLLTGLAEKLDTSAGGSDLQDFAARAGANVERLRLFLRGSKSKAPVLGVTGTGGAGKSSLVDELLQRFLNYFPGIRIGVVCVDPSKRKTGGALLGDRIRMNSLSRPSIYMRSLASRGSGSEIAKSLPSVLQTLSLFDFDLLISETSGIGQASAAITEIADLSLYVMTSEFGAQSQLEKIDMLDFADFISVNKADHRGSEDALRDVRKQFRRSRKLFTAKDDEFPVFLTQAAQFNDVGVNQLFFALAQKLAEWTKRADLSVPQAIQQLARNAQRQPIVPPARQNYLAEIVSTVRAYKSRVQSAAQIASDCFALKRAGEVAPELKNEATRAKVELEAQLSAAEKRELDGWEEKRGAYLGPDYEYKVRGQSFRQPLVRRSLSGLDIRRVVFPQFQDWGERLRFLMLENMPGFFPFTAGVFPLKREDEDPIRMFAGEGTPQRTNRRFHYLSHNAKAKRLSTAFDSVTLYGHDPDPRPDIYGKVGESGVSICTLEDMKKLYTGFDLCDALTSVSMTINGPAPIILAFYMNAAIDQQMEKRQNQLQRELTPAEQIEVRQWTLSQVRGTVQADILKEDQGQNTCIFSIDFALKMMGDIQDFFVQHHVRNFYSVSISGYHIAEAGANPISQLAFTLSNAFTFVEYYLSRGMKIDDFAPNLSFFFSNGLDPEYAVIGRVARRIWAIAMRDLYKGEVRSQKLKYHIQTSGRSLHAQEISFNDIRTTLQALIAIYDNCNSLHTNAYDEAITTPTEESVRRAMAIQMIINREFGMAKNENPMQGSYFLSELTDLVEEAVLDEFMRINERGGVLGAIETQYQRGRIQDESMYYEHLKHSGELPIVGVNTFQDPKTLAADYVPAKIEMARASDEEKQSQLTQLGQYQQVHGKEARTELEKLKQAAVAGENIFAALMSAARHCSLGEMTQALFEVGGQYRRNL